MPGTRPPAAAVSSQAELLATAFLIRAAEQRLLELFAQGKLFGTVHTCIGQELGAAALGAALGEGDVVVSNHRGHGHFLARTGDLEGLLAETMGKRTGASGGRGGSQHLHAPGFFSNGIQGSTVPVAAGLACALKLRGSRAIAATFVGDGTLGEGTLYETLNIASKWELPLLVVLENNRYAQSTSQEETLAGDIEARAKAFGIAAGRADVWDLAGLRAAAERAVAHVRDKRQPFFLRVDCDRLMAHSKGDDNRDPAEIAKYWERDPLQVFAAAEPDQARRLQAEAKAKVDAAAAKAEAAPWPEPAPGDEDPAPCEPCSFSPAPAPSADRVAARLNAAFKKALESEPRLLLMGEDIAGSYGGAFKVTKGLSAAFPGRVRNTPISEAAITGVANGLALSGLLPVVEIMFGDFVTLAADQWINSAAKFRYMYGGKVSVPVVLRTPMGGRRGYGPTHSQSLEKHLLGVPGTLVLALNAAADPAALYETLFKTADRPTLVVENKLLYGASCGLQPPPGFRLELSDERFPTVRVAPEGRADLTLLCYGGMLGPALEAAQKLFAEEELACEIVCPQQLYPFNAWPLLDSARRTGRLLVAEEGQGFAAFGSEAVARLHELDAAALKASRRVSAARHAIPSSKALELQALPGAAAICAAARELARG